MPQPPVALRPLQPADAAGVARLHHEQLRGLLHEFGPWVATAFYRAACAVPQTIGFVVAADRPFGFVLGASEVDSYYRRVAWAAPWSVGGRMACRLATQPALLQHLGGGAPAHGAELLFLAVAPAARGQGHGGALLAAFEAELRRRGGLAYELSVEADNAAAIAVYEHCGLARVAEFTEYGLARYRYRRTWPAAAPVPPR